MSTQRAVESPPAAAVSVPDFIHDPGRHCGSTALRNLVRFYGVDLPEGVLFGLAAGACFYYVAVPNASPSRFINGRAARLEHQLLEIAPGPFELRESEDADEAWSFVRNQINGGKPAVLLTDLYYLEYYDSSAHFPGHAVVIVGYDDEYAYLADTDKPGLQPATLSSLAKARHAQIPPIPLKGEMITVRNRAELRKLAAELPTVCRRAIAYAAGQMLEPQFGDIQGVPALRRWAAEIARWPEDAADWQWCTRFAYQVIERRGTGGGNFRGLYAEFLEFADEHDVAGGLHEAARSCAQLAADWTALAMALKEASEEDEPSSERWTKIAEQAENLALAEEELWRALATAVA